MATLALLAALVGLIFAGRATAADPILADVTPGFTGPAGIFRDDNGDLWVSDSHAGLCRVQEDLPPGTPALVASPYCTPNPLDPRIGPVAPGQSAYDPKTGHVWIGDGASNSGGVWRFKLVPEMGHNVVDAVVEPPVKILDYSAPTVRDRVFGMAYRQTLPNPALDNGFLDFATKNSSSIQRLANPRSCVPAPAIPPAIACSTFSMGSAIEPEAASLVHDASGKLYITDLGGVTVIDPASLDTAAKPVAGLDVGTYSALAFDAVEGRIYAGTTNPEGSDSIDALRLSDGAVTTYSEGFDAVTAIHVNRDSQPIAGGLDVADDPDLKRAPEDVGGNGRRWIVPYELFVPRPIIIDGPPAATNASTVTFAYRYPQSTQFYCSLDSIVYTACGTGDRAQTSYGNLPDGGHLFQVRGGNPLTGPVAKRRFAVDRTAPVVTPQAPVISGSSVEIPFLVSELNVSASCRINGLAPAPCDSPVRYTGLANGLHTVTIQASDFLGNQGPAAETTFRIGPPPTPAWKPGPITATLRGQTLRVVFDAPPGAKFARFTLTKKPVYPVRTAAVAVRGGRRNVVTVQLPRTSAQRIHTKSTRSKPFAIRIDAGPTKKRLAPAGQSRLRILAPLSPKRPA